MAYPYYPYSNPYPNFPQQNFQQPTPTPQPTPPVQNGGFVVIPKEDIVYNYPVGMGNCVTFKVEGQPIVLEKTGPLSQFDTPKIVRYRLVKEEMPSQETQEAQTGTKNESAVDLSDYIKKSEFEPITKELGILKKELSDLKTSLGEEGGKNE